MRTNVIWYVVLAVFFWIITGIGLGLSRVMPGVLEPVPLLVATYVGYAWIFAVLGVRTKLAKRSAICAVAFSAVLIVLGFLPQGASMILLLLIALAPVAGFVLVSRWVSPFKKWEVWHADVPFEEKGDSKMRPVVILDEVYDDEGERRIEALYVTSQNRDAEPGFRAVNPSGWEFGYHGEQKSRSWVRLAPRVRLDPHTAFDRRIGALSGEEIEKISRGLEQAEA